MSTQQNTNHSSEQVKAQMNVEDVQTVALNLSVDNSVSEVGYFELEEVPVRKVDPLVQLKQNIDRLQELSSRFAFLNREVRYLLKV